MSKYDRKLPYDDELVDDGPLVNLFLGSKWVSYLIGLLEILTLEELWDSSEDVSLAVRQVDEIRCRLLGGTDMRLMQLAAPTIEIRGINMYWYDGVNPVRNYHFLDASGGNFARSDDVNTPEAVARFDVYLPAGTYRFTVLTDEASNRGRLGVSCDELGQIIALTDTYATTLTRNVEITDYFDNPTAQLLRFYIERGYKNASSTGNMIVVYAVYIVEDDDGT